ncbi:hypothetical protein [Streptomyces justiciae]|uniref:hypothetical protein n=1 Tax=Streptomyces justiciae TaxID=2780140 RepID=UPI0021189D07|nr:hypothetical protein [Streptomyces justiciae]MCW8382402.1 hypothetical protein [Streptomyces justiciae]
MDINGTFTGLFWGAKRFAHSALDAHANDDEEVFLLHAGVSIERLSKAVLAKKSPFLLMEMKGNDDALFQIAGLEQGTKIRTIGAAQAIIRLKRLGVLPQAKDPDLDELIELRNGVAHLLAAHDGSFDGLTVFAKTTTTLLNAWGDYGAEPYWGPHYRLVELTLSEALEKAARHFNRLIEQARYRLAERTKDLPSATKKAYVEENTQRRALTWPESRSVSLPRKCPACGNFAALFTSAPVLIKRGSPAEAFPRRLFCLVCHLDLRTAEDLASAGMDGRVPLVDLNGERVLTEAEEVLWYELSDDDDHEKAFDIR